MRILCIDFGTKTLGIAVSDDLGMLGHGVGTIRRSTLRHDLAQVRAQIERYQAERIVIGLPRNMDGSLGPAAHRVLAFADILTKTFKLPVETWDERLSTVEAEQQLLDARVPRNRRRRTIDTVAAAVILQGYLDHLRGQEAR